MVTYQNNNMKPKVRLHRKQSNAQRSLATFASGRSHHLLKINQPFINNFVKVKLSNRSQNLRPIKTCRTLLLRVARGRFASNLIASLDLEFSLYMFSQLLLSKYYQKINFIEKLFSS